MYKETLRRSHLAESPPNMDMPGINDIGGLAASPAQQAQAKFKINRVCDAFLEALKGRHDTNLHNVITAHVCKSPPDLDAGLSVIAQLRGTFHA